MILILKNYLNLDTYNVNLAITLKLPSLGIGKIFNIVYGLEIIKFIIYPEKPKI